MSLLSRFRQSELTKPEHMMPEEGDRNRKTEVRSVEVSPEQPRGRMGDSFLAYPVGEWENRHRMMEAEYRSYLQNTYKNRPKSRTPEPAPVINRTNIRRTREVQSLYIGDIERRRKEVLQEPRDSIYFPFGRPGGGAPLKDPKSRLLGTVDPAPVQVAEERQPAVRDEMSPTRITSFLTPQDIEKKAKLQESMRRILDEQIEERKWRSEEERRARMLEDQMEEERLAKQRLELEQEYRRELRSREQYETGNGHSEKLPKPKIFASPQSVQPPLTDPAPQKSLIRPSPVPYQPSKYVSKAFVSDDRMQQLRIDMAGRQQTLQDLIMRLKEESQGMALEKMDAIREFDQLRESIRNRTVENEQKVRRQQLGYYYTGPWRETYQPKSYPHFQSKLYQHESRFFPLARAGQSVLISSPAKPIPESRTYAGVESSAIQMQLTKLDGILDYYRGGAEPLRVPSTVDEMREAEKDMDDRQVTGLEAQVDVEESGKFPEAMG